MTIQAPAGKPALKYLGNQNKKVERNFTQIPNEVMFGLGKYAVLKSNDVRVYGVLLHQVNFRLSYNKQVDSNGDAYCYLTQDQLGEKANIGSRKTVEKSVKQLEQLGLVYASWNGVKKCYAYYVALPEEIKNDEKVLIDVNEIGKKLTPEEREAKKAKRERQREVKAQMRESLKHYEVKRAFESKGIIDIDLDATLEQVDNEHFVKVNDLSIEQQRKYNCKYVRDYYLKTSDDKREICEQFYRVIERKNAAGKIVVEVIDGIQQAMKKHKQSKETVQKALYKFKPQANVYNITSHGMVSDGIDLDIEFESEGYVDTEMPDFVG